MGPRGGMSMGRGVTIPGGLGLTGVIIFLLVQVLSGGGSSGAYSVDDPFGQAPAAPAADGRGIPAAQDPERDLTPSRPAVGTLRRRSGPSTAPPTSAYTWT